MEKQLNRLPDSNLGAFLGVVLVLTGLAYLAIRYLSVDVGDYGWPLFVILPGLALVAFGVAVRSASGLAIPGAIVTVVGLILAVQNTFGLWATWSYAWALVAPGAVGLGIAIKGVVDRNQTLVLRGSWIAAVGLGLFAVFALFFEGALRISGVDFGIAGNVIAPVALIAIGVTLLLWTSIKPDKVPTESRQ